MSNSALYLLSFTPFSSYSNLMSIVSLTHICYWEAFMSCVYVLIFSHNNTAKLILLVPLRNLPDNKK